jgi:hypothetical protein
MNMNFKSLSWFAAMIAVAAAGLFQVIDQTSMIVLAVVVVATGPASLRGCRLPWRSA